MAFQSILDEVDQLHSVSTRLEGLAEQNPPRVRSATNDRRKCSQYRCDIGNPGSDKAAQRVTLCPDRAQRAALVAMRGGRFRSSGPQESLNMLKRVRPVIRKHVALPPKPLHCSLCSFMTTLGPNDLQLHLDAEHRGWAEKMIKKMDIHETE